MKSMIMKINYYVYILSWKERYLVFLLFEMLFVRYLNLFCSVCKLFVCVNF